MEQKWRRRKSLVQKVSALMKAFVGTISNSFYSFLSLVQAKLRSLHDFHQRLLHNSVPLPSGVDIANTIKYFSQTLLSKKKILNDFD
jgi:hypothetical protein